MIEHDNIHYLKHDAREIILIGTAHVSKESAELVKDVIAQEKPDTVCIELCASRYENIKNPDKWKQMDIVKVLKEKKAFILLVNFMLASFQRRMAKELGIQAGQEMLQAVESAKEHGAEVSAVDRDVRKTLMRTVKMLGWWTRLKFVSQIISSSFAGLFEEDPYKGLTADEKKEKIRSEIEEMKKKGSLELLMDEMGENLPDVKKRLIDERDLYMIEKIRESKGQRMVAVVGAGHVPGMLKHWEKKDISCEELEQEPPKSVVGTALKFVIPVLILAALISGFYLKDNETGLNNIIIWFAANSICTGIATALILPSPLTVIVGAVVAPFASLNPMMPTSIPTALTEAYIKKPKVEDFEGLHDAIMTKKGWMENAITRVIIVFGLSTIGSALGTWLAILLISRNLL